MADITIVCPGCRKSLSLSEYTDLRLVPCPACGHNLGDEKAEPTLETEKPSDKKARLRLKTKEPGRQPATEAAEPREPTQADLMRETFSTRRNIAKTKRFGPERRQQLLALLVFAVTGGLFALLRHGGVLGGIWLDYLKDYGWILVAVMYLVTVCYAFSYDMMSGLLCLLVPGYFIYHLLVSDRIFLRAVFIGILVSGIGLDAWRHLASAWASFYARGMSWILSGGGA